MTALSPDRESRRVLTPLAIVVAAPPEPVRATLGKKPMQVHSYVSVTTPTCDFAIHRARKQKRLQ